eukprot:4614900-Prymnesium_polylepis.1
MLQVSGDSRGRIECVIDSMKKIDQRRTAHRERGVVCEHHPMGGVDAFEHLGEEGVNAVRVNGA